MNRYWMYDAFVRIHARNLKVHDQSVYMALSSHANRNKETFVGYRTIAREMGMNKDTVVKCIKRLIAYGLVVRLDKKIKGGVSVLKLSSVLFENGEASDHIGQKEYIKENYKGTNVIKNNNPESVGEIMSKGSSGLDELRKRWGRKERII